MLKDLFFLSIAVFCVAQFLPGVRVKHYGTAILVAVVYSIIDFLLFWILTILTLPLNFLTLGLFTLVINAFLLWLTDQLMDDFEIDGPATTFIAALLITIANWLLHVVF